MVPKSIVVKWSVDDEGKANTANSTVFVGQREEKDMRNNRLLRLSRLYSSSSKTFTFSRLDSLSRKCTV